jgi:hypothetical protein
MAYINSTDWSNVTSISNLLAKANDNTSGTFFAGIYWMLIVIVFFSSVAFGFEIALLLTFFFGLVLGLFMLYAGLISTVLFGITEGALMLIIVYLIYTSNRQ